LHSHTGKSITLPAQKHKKRKEKCFLHTYKNTNNKNFIPLIVGTLIPPSVKFLRHAPIKTYRAHLETVLFFVPPYIVVALFSAKVITFCLTNKYFFLHFATILLNLFMMIIPIDSHFADVTIKVAINYCRRTPHYKSLREAADQCL
jgi:hypothetical protein